MTIHELEVKLKEFCDKNMILINNGKTALTIIRGGGRQKEVVALRAYTVKLLREEGSFSYPRIGRFVNRDHTTAMYLYRKYKDSF